MLLLTAFDFSVNTDYVFSLRYVEENVDIKFVLCNKKCIMKMGGTWLIWSAATCPAWLQMTAKTPVPGPTSNLFSSTS